MHGDSQEGAGLGCKILGVHTQTPSAPFCGHRYAVGRVSLFIVVQEAWQRLQSTWHLSRVPTPSAPQKPAPPPPLSPFWLKLRTSYEELIGAWCKLRAPVVTDVS